MGSVSFVCNLRTSRKSPLTEDLVMLKTVICGVWKGSGYAAGSCGGNGGAS